VRRLIELNSTFEKGPRILAERPSDPATEGPLERISRGAQATNSEHPQAGSCQTAKDDGGKPGVRFLFQNEDQGPCLHGSSLEQDKEEDGFAHLVGKRPKKEPLFGGALQEMETGSDFAIGLISSPRSEQDREINGLIDVPARRTPSAAVQTIESAAGSGFSRTFGDSGRQPAGQSSFSRGISAVPDRLRGVFIKSAGEPESAIGITPSMLLPAASRVLVEMAVSEHSFDVKERPFSLLFQRGGPEPAPGFGARPVAYPQLLLLPYLQVDTNNY
jgi:hypothetical protein